MFVRWLESSSPGRKQRNFFYKRTSTVTKVMVRELSGEAKVILKEIQLFGEIVYG
jgi:hypothetical protein